MIMPRAAVPKKAAPKKRGPRAFKLPDPIPPGEILKDVNKKEWKLGQTLGKGGFGELYLAEEATARPVSADARYVVKIEPKENGPLFVEQAVYQRIGKPEMVADWKKKHKMAHLGMPTMAGTGRHDRGKTEFRFLVMERFGQDIWKKYLACNKRFSVKTAFTLAIQIVDVLEYIHSTGYSHADIKSANLLLGYGPKEQNQVYLVDYGLAARFCVDGQHREYKEDPKRAHDGTPEFTSLDAHSGVLPSRRGDLEILGYVLTQWLASSLPWEHKISETNTDFAFVTNQKKRYMSNVGSLMTACFPSGDHPAELQKYMEYVSKLKYEEVPDYKHLKELFTKAITRTGSKADGKLDFAPPLQALVAGISSGKANKRKAVGLEDGSPKKAAKHALSNSASSATDSDSPSGSKNPRRRGPRSPEPARAKVNKKPVSKSPLKSAVGSPPAKSRTEIRKDLAKKTKSSFVRKSPCGNKNSKMVSPSGAGETITRRKPKNQVPKMTTSTQTSPGVKNTAKIKRKR